MSLIHRSRDANLVMSEDGSNSAFPMVAFFVYGGPEDRDLSALDADDLEEVYDASYAPDPGMNRFIYGFDCESDTIITAQGIELDDPAFKDIEDFFGEGFRAATGRGMTREEAQAFLDATDDTVRASEYGRIETGWGDEPFMPGSSIKFENLAEDGGWKIQHIRAETASRMGHLGVEDWDENGTVVIVSFRGREELNNRFFFISEDPRHLAERNPELAQLDSWGEMMKVDIKSRSMARESEKTATR